MTLKERGRETKHIKWTKKKINKQTVVRALIDLIVYSKNGWLNQLDASLFLHFFAVNMQHHNQIIYTIQITHKHIFSAIRCTIHRIQISTTLLYHCVPLRPHLCDRVVILMSFYSVVVATDARPPCIGIQIARIVYMAFLWLLLLILEIYIKISSGNSWINDLDALYGNICDI